MENAIVPFWAILSVSSIVIVTLFSYKLSNFRSELGQLSDQADNLIGELEQLKADRQSLLRSLEFLHNEQGRLVEHNAALEIQGDKLLDAINKACEEIGEK